MGCTMMRVGSSRVKEVWGCGRVGVGWCGLWWGWSEVGKGARSCQAAWESLLQQMNAQELLRVDGWFNRQMNHNTDETLMSFILGAV